VRQPTFGELSDAMLEADANARVSVHLAADTDEDDPGWESTAEATLLEVRLNAASLLVKEEGAVNEYAHPVTHEAFCQDDYDLRVGSLIKLTHRRREVGTWRELRTAERTTFLLLGKTPIPGVPGPDEQVRLDLWQRTAVT
jgi:hypothetical protein